MNAGAVHRIMLASAFAGLFSAAVLSVAHILDLPVPCGGSPGCATVASHPSSKLFGVPIAFFGVTAYLVEIALIGRAVIERRARLAAFVLAGLGAVTSTGLLIYSHRVIQATCPWCVASGIAMAVMFVCGAVLLWSEQRCVATRPALVWTLGFATALAIGAQAGRMQRAASLPPISAERLAMLTPAQLLDPAKSMGPADAAVTITVFADFLCPACRGALASLLEYQNRNPRAVRLVYRHHPLSEIQGHTLSKAAAALSEMAAERGKFWEFVDGVHGDRKALTRETSLELMVRLGFDAGIVEARLDDEAEPAIARVQRDIALATQLGIISTPTFILKIGTHAPISVSQWNLPRVLNSPAVISALANEHRAVTRS
jgi:protein-disulfide isomerase